MLNQSDTALLNAVYKNAMTSKETLEKLKEISTDRDFCDSLKAAILRYTAIFENTKKIFTDEEKTPDGLPLTEKVIAAISIKLSTLSDKSASHVADIIIQAGTKEMTDMLKQIRTYISANDKITKLASELLKTAEVCVSELKRYV